MSTLERSSHSLVANETGNRVLVQLVKLGEPRTVSDDGGKTTYREAIDSVVLADKVLVRSEHGGPVIGHADMGTYDANPDPTVELVVADTAAGKDSLALIRSGALTDVSIEFIPDPADTESDGIMRRSNALVHAVALAARPAHTAPIISTRETPTTEKETTMSTEDVPQVTPADLDTIRDEFKRELQTVNVIPEPAASPLSKFRSQGEFLQALIHADDSEHETLSRALSDMILANSPGVDRPGYVNDIKTEISFGRPTISAFGVVPVANGQGSSVAWPVNANDESTMVGTQSPEKTEVTSAVWNVTEATASLGTWAGAGDVSYQIIRRSTPSFLDAYMRALARAYAIHSNTTVGAQVVAAATAGTVWNPATGTADELRDVLFRASVAVESATNMPAEFVLAASDAYIAIGSLAGLYPAPYSVQNVAGTADARSLNVNVNGLPVIHDRTLANGTILVSNSSAGKTHEDGPFYATSENVALAGRDVGIYGMGVFAPYVPAGIISIPAA